MSDSWTVYPAPSDRLLCSGCVKLRYMCQHLEFLDSLVHSDLQDLLTRVDDFQQRSERLLSDDSPSPQELQELLDVSLGLDVELPQLPLLRERLEQARWLEAVQQASSWPDSLCLDTMRRLIDQGVGLAPHSSVERAMARLQELLTVSEQWEEKVLSLMEAR